MAIDKINKFKDIRGLISVQLEYLNSLEKQYLKNGEKDYHSPSNAGFFRVSLELNKQINKLKSKK